MKKRWPYPWEWIRFMRRRMGWNYDQIADELREVGFGPHWTAERVKKSFELLEQREDVSSH